MAGPLSDVKIVELAGQGPAPFAAALLADFGADVAIIDRPPESGWRPEVPRAHDFYNRNKRSVALDLKSGAGQAAARALVARADILIEGFRPGVAERLGLGPDECLGLNPRLIYGRMTGWGQDGPMAQEAGHDINYLALTGALYAIGQADSPPPPPLNLVADLGGGGMFLVAGLLMALHHARATGRGQVVDCAMLDGVSQLMSAFHAFRQQGGWSQRRQDNIVDGGAPYFCTYQTSDGQYVAVGAMEPQFYANLLAAMGLDPATLPDRDDRANWPVLRARFAQVFASRTRAGWETAMAGRDACFAPVLGIDEARAHPQMTARGVFRQMAGQSWPAPAPRLSLTPGELRNPAPEPGADTRAVLRDWGVEGDL
ncbi:CaiB/BaiF CoA transferase family protein [Paracoccus sp. (in: a-proteobacteria)]|uniref:CaiB/BaiF CoA transferase family protein n=1 Tax=Paracoccus sp. TaxID=267 RepID=UPI003A8A353B